MATQITVCISSYFKFKEKSFHDKWMVNFCMNLPLDIENIVPCESVCLLSDGQSEMTLANESALQKFLDDEEVCFPNNFLLSGDFVLVLQDLIRHPTMYSGISHLNGITFGFATVFGITVSVKNVAVLVDGKRRCYVDLNIWLMFSMLLALSQRTLNPSLRYQYKNLVQNSRKEKTSGHSCENLIMTSVALSLKELASVQVTKGLPEMTDINGILCFPEMIKKLELPWNLSENLMSERCICFRPEEVLDAHLEWKCSLLHLDMLETVSCCYHDDTELHIKITTKLGQFDVCIPLRDFERLQKILQSEGWTTSMWHTYLITGESFTIAVDKYYETTRLYFLTKFFDMDELRHITMTETVTQLLSTFKVE